MSNTHTISHDDVIRAQQPIEGWLSVHEALLLFHLAKRNSAQGDIVEIGSWKGKSTVCLGLGVKASGTKRIIHAVDPHEGKIRIGDKKGSSTLVAFRRNVEKADLMGIISPVVSTSEAYAMKWRAPISFLFIDGLHDYEHAKEDYMLWSPYVSDGGIIAFHDGFCGYPGVWKAINELVLSSLRICDIGTVSSILYVTVGKQTVSESIVVFVKKYIARLANSMSTNPRLPRVLNTFIVHRVLRILLITRPTLEVYGI